MSRFDVYDESVRVSILRAGRRMQVEFWQIRKGDVVFYDGTYGRSSVVCGEEAHISNDPDYQGWLFHSEGGMGYFPEDFGAQPKEVEDWIWSA